MTSKKHNDKYINRRDIFGRNFSYILSSLANVHASDEINAYSHELESGYTPLHTTLKQNQIKKAFQIYKHWKDEIEFSSNKQSAHILNEKDREGLSPIDLYNIEFQNNIQRLPKRLQYSYPNMHPNDLIEWATEEECQSFELRANVMKLPKTIEEEQYLKANRGSHILTLGSNTNFQLGTGTKDDRQNFFQMHINQLDKMIFPPSDNRFSDLKITKYHSIIRTKDDSVYTCGNSSRGRLGNGSTDKPSFIFTKILDFKENGISILESSDNHSILLDGYGDVYSWGWNAYGQLCYSTTNSSSKKYDDTSIDNLHSNVPKRVHFFDDKTVIKMACSPIHTCILTNDRTLYIWGLNIGQMGSKKINHLEPDAEYMGESGHIMTKPVILNLSHLEIKQIVATEFATLLRCKGNTLVVLSGHSMRTFRVSIPHAKNYKEIDTFNHFAHRGLQSDMVDMKCSNQYGNNLAIRFACGRIGLVSSRKDSLNIWTRYPNVLPITLAWSPNLNIHNCLDFDVGSKGELIISTYGGELFMTDQSTSKIQKIHCSKLITGRALTVSCDSSFDSFAIIKDEYNSVPFSYKENNIRASLRKFSPLSSKTDRCYDSVTYGEYFSVTNDPTEEARTSRIEVQRLSDSLIRNTYDVTFRNTLDSDKSWDCHKVILNTECHSLVKYLREHKIYTVNDGVLIFSLKNSFSVDKWVIEVSSSLDSIFINEALDSIIHMIYTYERPVDQQIARIATHIIDDSLHNLRITDTLFQLLADPLNDTSENCDREENLNQTDIIIHLKDDEILEGHSMILSSQSIFFNIALNNGFQQEDTDNKKHIHLEHISRDIFVPILRFMYGIPFENIFDIEQMNVSFINTLNFLLDSLGVYDQLNILPLKLYAESILSHYINGGTVIPILLNAESSKAYILLRNCYLFIRIHIGIIFCKENLGLVDDYFNEEIWGNLNTEINILRNDTSEIKEFQSWYDNENINWVALFKNNIAKFNSYFMHGSSPFDPIFEQRSEPIRERRRSSSRRSCSSRNDSVHQSIIYKDSRQPSNGSFSDISQQSIILKNPWGSSSPFDSENASALEDEPSEFVEVTKKSKRKSVHNRRNTHSEILNVPVNMPAVEVVMHSGSIGDSNELPSLLIGDIKNSNVDNTPVNNKISGTFKKNSQKQRKHIHSIESTQEKIKEQKPIWGKSADNQKMNKRKDSSTSNNLPSLLASNVADLKSAPKRSKKKNTHKHDIDKKYTEFVSTGNSGGLTPYVISETQHVNEISNVFGDKTGKTVSSLEEQVAALEFEKWFAEESAKVQKKLKKKRPTGTDIKILYTDTKDMPTLNANSNKPAAKRKMRGNFKKKDGRSLAEIL
ncbi:hypothetical protein C6P45_002715 [Maudiozyma exigua]|uniref:BTB domain-containing protein n=1 Tax=Maudiozyma exigua TaxID=34358 RepID=A0A9P6VXF3_MAUEX|nr:hypothetical protein C6P45_002715 [Kazachstania exigua]